MVEYVDFYCQCEACFNKQTDTIIQYKPIVVKGKVVMKCPSCGATTGQTMLVG
jgi:hypothetical protein